jgi:hypothetical protein
MIETPLTFHHLEQRQVPAFGQALRGRRDVAWLERDPNSLDESVRLRKCFENTSMNLAPARSERR